MHVAVIGAGAFGGWTALHLQKSGVRVTLIDAWGPGNSRSSSGGETRMIRCTYGADELSCSLAQHSLHLWKEYEIAWNKKLFYKTGALFLGGRNDDYLSNSARMLQHRGIAVHDLSRREASARYPQICFDNIDSFLFEPDAGFLTARQNCRTVVRQFERLGGRFEVAAVREQRLDRAITSLRLSDDSELVADQYVFACGPWLRSLFPDALGNVIRPSRQEVVFLGVPAGDTSFGASSLPCWGDRTSELKYYGIPDFESRGFKIASDLRGATIDPGLGDRTIEQGALARLADYMRMRFPALVKAPLIESRVCVYENTPDLSFLVDRHPVASNVLLLGGGSGHGYKCGPALGEYVAGLLMEKVVAEPAFRLQRFAESRSHAQSSF